MIWLSVRWSKGKWFVLPGVLVLGGVGYATSAGAGAVMDDGPWRVTIGTDEVGRVFSTDPTGAASARTWEEHFERRDAKWFWVQSGKSWTVTVDQLYGGSGNPAPAIRCSTTVDGVTYLACQKTVLTRQGTSGKTPAESFGGNSGSVRMLNYHADGHINIDATWSSGGTNYSKHADYYVKTDPGSTGDNTLRSELLCTQSGFKWPSRSAPLNAAVTWTMTWNSTTVLTTCPAGTTTHSYLVDLQ